MFLGSQEEQNNTNIGVEGRPEYTFCYIHDYNEHFSRCNC